METLDKEKNKLYVFGCSFSSKHLKITEKDVYGHLLAEDLGMELHNFSKSGLSNEMSLLYLTKIMKKITKDDIVIFQFTSYNRRAYLRDEKNIDDFHTSTGITDQNLKEKLKQFNYGTEIFTEHMIETLLHFHIDWQRRTIKILHETIKNVLNQLKCKVYKMYMNDLDFDILNPYEKCVKYPTKDNVNNISMNTFNIDHDLVVSPSDPHPNKEGHFRYKEIIKNLIYKFL